MPSSHDQQVVREKTHAEVARDTVSSLISREGLLGLFSVVLIVILFSSLYLNFDKAQRMERFLKEESNKEALLRKELVAIQRESVAVRKEQSILMRRGATASEQNAKAIDQMRVATEANIKLMDVLTRQIISSGENIRKIAEMERKRQAKEDAR